MVLLCFSFELQEKHPHLPILFTLSSPSHTLTIPLFPYLPSSALSYLSSALPAVTAYLCEPMIYHLLIRDDYGAFHTALICCWARFSLHSCQLSFRQPANRPVSVSQVQSCHQGLLRFIYWSMIAMVQHLQAAWVHVFLVQVLVQMSNWVIKFNIMFYKCLCTFTKSLNSCSTLPTEGRMLSSRRFWHGHLNCLEDWSQSWHYFTHKEMTRVNNQLKTVGAAAGTNASDEILSCRSEFLSSTGLNADSWY